MFTPRKSNLDLHAAQVLPVTPISDDPFAERVTNSWGVSPDGKAIEISSLRRETKLQIGSYDGQAWRCWIARGETLQAVDITAKRLFW